MATSRRRAARFFRREIRRGQSRTNLDPPGCRSELARDRASACLASARARSHGERIGDTSAGRCGAYREDFPELPGDETLSQFPGHQTLGRARPQHAAYDRPRRGWMAAFGLSVPMLSDYPPLDEDLAPSAMPRRTLCRLARGWGAGKVRTFAGNNIQPQYFARRPLAALGPAQGRLHDRRGSGLPNPGRDTPWNVCRHAVVDAAADRRGRPPCTRHQFRHLASLGGRRRSGGRASCPLPHIRHYHLKTCVRAPTLRYSSRPMSTRQRASEPE